MQDGVHRSLDVDVIRDVVLDEDEVPVREVRDVPRRSGQEIVDADDGIATVEERFRQMGADESGGAGDYHSGHE
jgi:hypothetical protein